MGEARTNRPRGSVVEQFWGTEYIVSIRERSLTHASYDVGLVLRGFERR